MSARPTVDEVRTLLDYARRWADDAKAMGAEGRNQTIVALCEAEIARRTLRWKRSMLRAEAEILLDHEDNRKGLVSWMPDGGNVFWSYGPDRGEASTYEAARDHVEERARADGWEVLR